MTSATIGQILRELDLLSPELQRRVLDFAHALAASSPKGTPGKDLLSFAGVLNEEAAQAMSRAIEEGCERVDASGW